MIYLHGPGRRRRPLHKRPGQMRGMGDLSALVIGAEKGLPPGELWRRGMAGMGDDTGGGFLNTLTGGAVADISAKLAKVEFALKLSTAAAVASALLSFWLSTRRRT